MSLLLDKFTIGGMNRSPGWCYGSGRAPTAFFTMTPPNTPTCNTNLTQADTNSVIIPASSYHSGGVNVAMADGSVRFISDSVDVGNPSYNLSSISSEGNWGNGKQPGHLYIGESPYGVWGAMGSANGGESKAL